jgi:pimeloyl-ACP methyl ester carboxylesterase
MMSTATQRLLPTDALRSASRLKEKCQSMSLTRAGPQGTLVRGREDVYFGWQFATKASTPAAVPGYAVNYYVDAITRDPDALHRGTFDFYRTIDQTAEQNVRRRERRLKLPVLAIGGADGLGGRVAATMRLVADDVTPVVLEHCGHYVADEAAEGMLEALESFLAPYAAGK